MKNDLLIEIGCEELPPKALKKLALAFRDEVAKLSTEKRISYDDIDWFAAPRRLALILRNVEDTQPDVKEEKKGPSLAVAFDADGNPSKAAQGWARSLGLNLDEVDTLETDKGKWLYKEVLVKGKNIDSLIGDVVKKALSKLPIPKMMRWGSTDYQFVRPVHSYCLMHGSELIEDELFGIASGTTALGHRFHSPTPITIPTASEYQVTLEANRVIPCFQARKKNIEQQISRLSSELNAVASIDDSLLDEITALVEWPVAMKASFPASFLDVPKEALIYTMKDDQKYVPLLSKDGELLNTFLFISNIDSADPDKVIHGNEKVIRPRLHDAEFFYNEDKKISSDTRLNSLEKIVYQKQLGTMRQRANRIANIARDIAKVVAPQHSDAAYKAGLYAKSDLTSQMVYEFPSVQGSMGKYYAMLEGMEESVCNAIEEHYLPRFAGDRLPSHPVSMASSLADKIDQLVGIFSIGQIPTGDKDPFALRRAAIGLVRICIECKITLPLYELVDIGLQAHTLDNDTSEKVRVSLIDFIQTRLVTYYSDQGFSSKQIQAVISLGVSNLVEFNSRLQTTSELIQENKEAVLVLAALNKRVSNILKKSIDGIDSELDVSLLQEDAENKLYKQLIQVDAAQVSKIQEGQYLAGLVQLNALQGTITEFFDSVMVNVDDERVKRNRLALLKQVRTVFTRVLDFAELD